MTAKTMVDDSIIFPTRAAQTLQAFLLLLEHLFPNPN
jgi:hypothetical protein